MNLIKKEIAFDKKLAVIGVPFENGQSIQGLDQGPDFIRGSDLVTSISNLGYSVTDYGNIESTVIFDDYKSYRAKNPKTFKRNTMQCKRKVAEALYQNDVVLVLGGDRTVCTGSILGHWSINKNICVVFVGQKPSLHTLLSSTTGNMNEMAFSLILSEMQIEIPWVNEFKKITPVLSAKDIAFVGLRDVDNFEKYMINKYGIKAMSTCDIDRLGIEAVIRESIMTINPQMEKEIHLCFNVDAFDPIYGPSCNDGSIAGMTLREAIKLSEALFDTGMLKVIDILEVNPKQRSTKENRTTRTSVISTIMAAIGSKRCGAPDVDPNFYSWEKTKFRRGVRFGIQKKSI